MAASKIEWTESTWNPVIGCRRVSAGCDHCYAERMAKRLAAIAEAARRRGDDPGRAAHYSKVLDPRGGWNGKIHLDEETLREPYGWRTPRMVFVNSMSDLFHENVPLEFIRRLFAVIQECPQHTFQALTKRPERAARLSRQLRWPTNLWMGTSVENAATLHRVESLRRLGGIVRFLSCEPLLGPLDDLRLDSIEWVIVGGESGPGARPMKPEWVRGIQRKCAESGAAFFFKQWGGVNKKKAGRLLDGRLYEQTPIISSGVS